MPCPECVDGTLELRDSRYGPFYGCNQYPECDATHGAHRDGSPLGVPADAETKAARARAHDLFDRLWKGAYELPCYDIPEKGEERDQAVKAIEGAARARAYRWLATAQMLPLERTHFGEFDAETCREVTGLLHHLMATRDRDPRAFIREWAKQR